MTPHVCFHAYLTNVRFIAIVLVFCDVLMGDQEQNHLPLLVLDGNYVQQTPELGAFSKTNKV